EEDPELEARLLLLAADAAFAGDDVERARHAWERARAHFESYWNGAALARIYAGLALIGAAEPNSGGAPRVLAARALEEAETADAPLALGRACIAEAVVSAASDPGAAASWAVRASRIFDDHGLDRELAETCLRWGSLVGDDGDALPWLLRAEE